MFPVRSVVALGESYASEHEMLMANDSTYVSVWQSNPSYGWRKKPNAPTWLPPTPLPGDPYTAQWYEQFNPQQEAVAKIKDEAIKRVGRSISYKGYTIEAKLSDGNRVIKFHVSKDGRQEGIYETMGDAKFSIDEPTAREQKQQVQSWSDARVSASALARGLPSLDLLRDVEHIQVQPLKGPITTALEQGNPVKELEVWKAGQEQRAQQEQTSQEKKKSLLLPLLLGGAAIAVVTIAK